MIKNSKKILARPTHVYIGRKHCGCCVAICNDYQDKSTGTAVGKWIGEGLQVTRATFEEYRNKISNEPSFMDCPHELDDYQIPLPMGENPKVSDS